MLLRRHDASATTRCRRSGSIALQFALDRKQPVVWIGEWGRYAVYRRHQTYVGVGVVGRPYTSCVGMPGIEGGATGRRHTGSASRPFRTHIATVYMKREIC